MNSASTATATSPRRLDPTHDQTARAHARAALAVASQMASARLRRLTKLEGGLVVLLDRLDQTRDELARAESLQISALWLLGRLEDDGANDDDRPYTDEDFPGTPLDDAETPDVCDECSGDLVLENDRPHCPKCRAGAP